MKRSKVHSLRFKIPVLFTIAIIISIYLSIIVVLTFTENSVTKIVENNFASTSSLYDNLIKLWIDDNTFSINHFAHSEVLKDFLQNQNNENLKSEAEAELKYFRDLKRTFINFILLDLDGNPIIDSEDGKLNSAYIRISDDVWRKFVSEGYKFGSEQSMKKSRITGSPAYRIWSGIKDDTGKTIGVLSGIIDWNDLIERFIVNTKVGEIGEIIIIDGDKKILASQNRDKILEVDNSDPIYDEVIKNKNGFINDYKDSDNNIFLISYHNIDNTNWYLIIKKLESELYTSFDNAILLSILLGLGIIIVIGYIIILFTRRLTAPLKEALKLANLISGGDLTFDINSTMLKRKDEVGELIRSFDAMKNSIKDIIDVANSNIALTKRTAYSLAYANRDLSSRTLNQTSDLEKTAEATEEISKYNNKNS